MFSKNVGSKESKEAQVMAVLGALHIFSASFQGKLIVESDLGNAVRRVSHHGTKPWRLHFLFNELKELSTDMEVFYHMIRSANNKTDALAKQGVDRVFPRVASSL